MHRLRAASQACPHGQEDNQRRPVGRQRGREPARLPGNVTWIRLPSVLVSAGFGILTSNTPLAMLAWTWLGSTSKPSGTRRWKLPKLRSVR